MFTYILLSVLSLLFINEAPQTNSNIVKESIHISSQFQGEGAQVDGYCKKTRYGTRLSKSVDGNTINYTCSSANQDECFDYWVECEGSDAVSNAVAVSDGSGSQPVLVNYSGSSSDQSGNETLSFSVQ